jgi:hypothetical protein
MELVIEICITAGVRTAIACSLTLSVVPVQVAAGRGDVEWLFEVFMGRLVVSENDYMDLIEYDTRGHGRNFKVKAHPAASNKVNVWFSEISERTKIEFPEVYKQACKYGRLVKHLYNDQASAWLIQCVGLSGQTLHAVEYATLAILNPDMAKKFSVALKSLGLNGTALGSKLVEMEALQGRGVGVIDLHKEAGYRANIDLVKEKIVELDDEVLRAAVQQVYREELSDVKIEFEDIESMWNKRWAWTVNGSHSAVLGKYKPHLDIRLPGQPRMHRRAFMEENSYNILKEWDGVVYISASQKLEQSKCRCLLSGDTVSYCWFCHLLSPVEKAWKNDRVILDPGKGGTSGMVKRTVNMRGKGGSLMMDYDDFNSQHSIQAMKIVFSELVKFTGYDPDRGRIIVESFDKMILHVDGKSYGLMKGTMPSGHRGTTFINSVLNRAYLLVVAPDEMKLVKSMHVGDDIYMAINNIKLGMDLIMRVMKSPLRLNPAKQSIGIYTAEFLRMASSRTCTYGYLARSVAGIVSGNWVTERKMNATEALSSIAGACWTLTNRSGMLKIGNLFTSSLCRITGLERNKAMRVVNGTMAVGNGPSRQRDGYRDYVMVIEKDDVWEIPEGVKCLATETYLAVCTTEIERSVLASLGVSVKRAMVEASYKKSMVSAGRPAKKPKTSIRVGRRLVARSANFFDLWGGPKNVLLGVLSSYPILRLLKGILTRTDIVRIIEALIGDWFCGYTANEVAWGLKSDGVVCTGWAPYTDLCALTMGGRTADVVKVQWPIMA